MNPKISVITVVYNRSSVIGNCIDSVKSQNYKNYEHIIIDGLSNDGTKNVINNKLDPHIRFLSEADAGIFDAVNKGLRIATGNIIAVLNSDDYYFSADIFSSVVSEFSSGKYDMVFGNVQFVREPYGIVVRNYNSMIFTKGLIEYGFMPAHPAIFMSSSLIKKSGFYNTKYKIAGDFDYIARVFKLNDVRFKAVDKVFAQMIVGGVSTSGFRSKILLNKETLLSLRQNGYNSNWFKLLIKYCIKLKEFFI